MGRMAEFQFLARTRDFFLLHNIHTGSGAHPASYTMDTGVNWPGHEADHSSPSSAEVKGGGPIPPLLHMFSWRGD
jgi:hypothetical protein